MNQKLQAQPIFNHRTIVGYAKTPQQAQKVLKELLENIPKGWVIDVQQRDTSIIDLPAGFVYSIHP